MGPQISLNLLNSTKEDIMRMCAEEAERQWRRYNATTTTTTPIPIVELPPEGAASQDDASDASSTNIT